MKVVYHSYAVLDAQCLLAQMCSVCDEFWAKMVFYEWKWKVIHRHGDPIMDKTEVESFLQQEGSRDKGL